MEAVSPGERALAGLRTGGELLVECPCIRLVATLGPVVSDLWPGSVLASGSGCRVGCSAHDARGVAQLRRNHRRLQVEERHELVMILRHAAADDEKIGGEEHLDVGVVALKARSQGARVPYSE